METDGNYVYSGFRAHYTITAVSQEGEYMVIMKTAWQTAEHQRYRDTCQIFCD